MRLVIEWSRHGGGFAAYRSQMPTQASWDERSVNLILGRLAIRFYWSVQAKEAMR